MNKTKNNKEEVIEIPVSWLSDLLRHAKIAEKDKEHLMHLVGFASSADILLKYRKIKITKKFIIF